jgi:hypothetical protein
VFNALKIIKKKKELKTLWPLKIKWVKNSKKQTTKCVTTLVLGSRLKQGLAKVRAKREAQESHFMLPGVQKNVRE